MGTGYKSVFSSFVMLEHEGANSFRNIGKSCDLPFNPNSLLEKVGTLFGVEHV